MALPNLSSITIKGFKSFAAIDELPLRPVNIVIGPNGSGKSNFISLFSLVRALGEGKLKDYVIKAGGAEKLLHFGSRQTKSLDIQISFQGHGKNASNERQRYEISLDAVNDTLVPRREILLLSSEKFDKDSGGPVEIDLSSVEDEPGISLPQGRGDAAGIRDQLLTWRGYHFHDAGRDSPMKKTVLINDNRFLRPDGSNLAAFLYFLREKEKNSYEIIRATIQRIAPFFDDFQLEPLRLNPNTILLEWRHKGSDAYFDASMLSDGTLRFMALATLFLQPQKYRPSVILLDEPELGLHPSAITLLASLIQQASATSQVIVGTQSSLLLDHFQPEDVLVADRVDHATTLTRLETGRLEKWLSEYSLGQLWEKNEIGGRPSKE
jgi:predicted ATPase